MTIEEPGPRHPAGVTLREAKLVRYIIQSRRWDDVMLVIPAHAGIQVVSLSFVFSDGSVQIMLALVLRCKRLDSLDPGLRRGDDTSLW